MLFGRLCMARLLPTAERGGVMDANDEATMAGLQAQPPVRKPDLNAIRERCDKATRGPWEATPSEGDCNRRSKCPKGLIYCDDKCPECDDWVIYTGAWMDGPNYIDCGDYSYFTDEDANFIAHARTDIPALLDYIEKLEAVVIPSLKKFRKAKENRKKYNFNDEISEKMIADLDEMSALGREIEHALAAMDGDNRAVS